MLENIRENSQGVTAKIILGLIILTFAVAGVGSYTSTVDTSVAEVNGDKISQQAFEQAYQAQRNRLAQQFGEMFETLASDGTYLASLRQNVLDNLINEKLLDQNADALAIRISDERIKKTIREMPEFQVDGVFDNNRYIALINQAGFYQSSSFRDYMRVEMARRLLTQAIVGSEFSLPYQASQLAALRNQTRDIRFATISAEQFKAGVELTDEEVNQYYQDNEARYQNPERVKVDYVALDVADIAKTIDITEADAQAFYEQNEASFRTDAQRRVAHILLEFNDDEAAAEQQAQDLLNRLNQGEDFAELAAEFSADVVSAENGGDLDWLELGVMDPSFEQAALALNQAGQLSDVVRSDFGFHIIKLTDFKAEQVQSFEDAKAELMVQLSQDQARDKFFELQQELARVSFEFPDSLEDAAGVVNGQVQTSAWLTRGGNLAPFDNNSLVDAAFSDLVLNDNVNSDIIEVNDDLVMVVRLNEYKAANTKPLAEVEAGIKQALTADKASAQAQALADKLLATRKSGGDITSELAANNASFVEKTGLTRFGGDVDRNISQEAFVLPHPVDGAVSVATVALTNGDIALVEVTAVTQGSDLADPNLSQQQASQLAQASYGAYIESLKADAKITRKSLIEQSTNTPF
ncbi:SurA N-terminal domain-containing protein [Endozoicomonas sp. G2_1]|uniref:SurA N-terminal domain-containing protein n=1 Tax=Endozoicomonas sp. G2_1 TaxID=2821091 RepID=UPI001ADD56A3|nr:SurA N-terminal domain-containing protein [Endozoicomonas sp. G2_1]MBO9491515.1 SurA N-terminal domain-containing protein [Endozoicomonas sp. G2_1]